MQPSYLILRHPASVRIDIIKVLRRPDRALSSLGDGINVTSDDYRSYNNLVDLSDDNTKNLVGNMGVSI
jgi:hypothetical protein